MIAGAAVGQPQRDIVDVGDRLYLVVSQPARFAQETLGTFTVGYALDDAVARELAQVTHSEVALVVGSQVTATSLPDAERADMARLLANGQMPSLGSNTRIERLGARDYVAGAFPISARAGGPGRLLLLQDRTPVQLYLSRLQRQLFAAGAIIFVVSLAVGLVFARRVSRPLTDMASAAREVEAGQWSRQVPVRGSAEATTLAIAFNAMTTSLRHWYDQARKRDDELRQAQKMEAVGRLAGGIAHDFNNLLTAIRGYAELVLVHLKDEDHAAIRISSEIVAAADRAAELTKQLLAFSRRQVVAPRVLALGRVVTGMQQLVRRVIGEDIHVVTDIDLKVAPVRADRVQIEQVIINLVVNARDAMPNGGTVSIALSNTADNRVCLAVGDTGHGMDDETVARIFEPFFTTKETGRGTGLGPRDRLRHRPAGRRRRSPSTPRSARARRSTSFCHGWRTARRSTKRSTSRTGLAAFRKGSETVLLAEDDDRLSALIGSTLRSGGLHRARGVARRRGAEDRAHASDGHPPAAHRRRHARHERPRAVRAADDVPARDQHALHVRLRR